VYIENPIEGFNEYMQYKPFIIPEKLNTDTAKKIAEERLKIMRLYLEALNSETGTYEPNLWTWTLSFEVVLSKIK